MTTMRGQSAPVRVHVLLRCLLHALLLQQQQQLTDAQYAYHSPSPYGPWAPIEVTTAENNVKLPPGDIWWGPHCNKASGGGAVDPAKDALDCGGNSTWPALALPSSPGAPLPVAPRVDVIVMPASLTRLGGNNPSPYIIDHEAAGMTGLGPGTVVIATTWAANYSYDGEPARPRGSITVGICKNWSSACDLNPQVRHCHQVALFLLECTLTACCAAGQ